MLKEYIYNNNFQINIVNNYINILNYIEIVSFSENKIIIKYSNGTLVINGSEMIISKLLSDELLVKGNISNIEFR